MHGDTVTAQSNSFALHCEVSTPHSIQAADTMNAYWLIMFPVLHDAQFDAR